MTTISELYVKKIRLGLILSIGTLALAYKANTNQLNI